MTLRTALKWIGLGLGGLLVLVGIAGLVLFTIGRGRLNRPFEPPAGLASVSQDSASVALGEHVMRIHGCQGCHGEALGGQIFLDIPPGLFVASNLTRGRGGIGDRYTDGDWDHAIRYGVRPDKSPLIPVMPYQLFNHLSDEDAAVLIAYLKTLPAVDNELPSTHVRLAGYITVGLPSMRNFRGEPGRPPTAPPQIGTPAYGAYLASTICVECHGDHLQGGKHPAPDAPPGPGLVAATYGTEEVFATTVRDGIAPGDRKLSPWMPSQRLKYLTDEEIHSLWLYIQTLTPGTAQP